MVTSAIRVAACGPLGVLVFMANVARLMMSVLDQLSFRLSTKLPRRAQHAGSQRAPNREQHCEQQDEPEAKGLHKG